MVLLNSGIGNYVTSNGKKYSYFGGNNYLGLANHPVVKAAAIKSIEKYGVNFSASRRTTGTSDIHLELENKLSDFKGAQDTVVFASGYQGNSILLEVFKDRYSAVYADQFAHPSIIAGIKTGNTDIHYYRHLNADHLEDLLKKHRRPDPLIITDGVFALTGEIAPLDKIYPLVKKYNAILIVDDAHSTGVLGQTGKGTTEHFNLPDDENIFQSETMSKALGSFGGFISGRNDLVSLIRERSATYQASTALPPPVVAAGIASLDIIHQNPELRTSLLETAGSLRNRIMNLDFRTTNYNTAIIPIILPDADMAINLTLFLEENGIIVPFMNYPSESEMAMLRIAVSVSHTEEQTGLLLEMLEKWRKLMFRK
jgi:7-keto-8-aminopelargonate synthetase-like enzyme